MVLDDKFPASWGQFLLDTSSSTCHHHTGITHISSGTKFIGTGKKVCWDVWHDYVK